MTIEQSYRNQYPNYNAFTIRLEQLFVTILRNSGVHYHLVESRTKSVESFCEKINRKNDKYKNPLLEITDICALRIIVYYIDDLDKVEELLRENFNVDENNSYHAKSNMTENEFGYLSSHFVISLKNNRTKLPEWKEYKSLCAEVQVRTVLQHAWAAISHELEYKKKYEIPSVLKRKLYRLAGLIELADEEFQQSKEEHKAVELAIKSDEFTLNKQLKEEINLDTLKNYLSTNPDLTKQINEIGIKSGFEMENSVFTTSETNKYISDIIRLCSIKDINKINQFDNFLKSVMNSAQTKLTNLFKVDNEDWVASTEFIILLLSFLSLNEKQLAKCGKEYEWTKSTWRHFLKIAKEN